MLNELWTSFQFEFWTALFGGAVLLVGYVAVFVAEKFPRLGMLLGLALMSSPVVIYVKSTKSMFQSDGSAAGLFVFFGLVLIGLVLFGIGVTMVLASRESMDSPEYKAARARALEKVSAISLRPMVGVVSWWKFLGPAIAIYLITNLVVTFFREQVAHAQWEQTVIMATVPALLVAYIALRLKSGAAPSKDEDALRDEPRSS